MRCASMFDRFVARHDVMVAEARPGADRATASFAAVTGREEDLVAQQARLADLTVVPHPDAGEDVSSSDALHAVLFDSGRPVLISPQAAPTTIGTRVCLAWNGTAEVGRRRCWRRCRGCSAPRRCASCRPRATSGAARARPELAAYLALHDVQADIVMFQLGRQLGRRRAAGRGARVRLRPAVRWAPIRIRGCAS